MADSSDKDDETAVTPPADSAEAEQPRAEPAQAAEPEASSEDSAEEQAPDAGASAASEADAPGSATAPEASAPAEPAEQLTSKERRRRIRSTHSGQARPPRSPEERHAERASERQDKAVRRRARRAKERARAAERRRNAPAPEPLAPVHAGVEGAPKLRQGIVVSDKADKTITVRIDVARRHRRYEKIVRSSSTLHAHDEDNEAHEGDMVRVIESRPLSRSKRWRLVEVLERAR